MAPRPAIIAVVLVLVAAVIVGGLKGVWWGLIVAGVAPTAVLIGRGIDGWHSRKVSAACPRESDRD
jgi:hypothetical protein